MKTKRQAAKKRAVPKAKASARPLRKRVLLHPFSVMIILCAGVIIAGTTFHGFATSLNVGARVDAPLPASPAYVSSPVDRFHTTETVIDLAGSCPRGSYVVVFRDGQGAGSTPCVGTTFQVRLGLASGPNVLQAKVFNATNQEGPASSPVTIFRDPIPQAPVQPLGVPLTLKIESVEKSGFKPSGGSLQASVNPTVSGFAPPFSDITVTFHSEPSTCITRADASGWWSCTLGNTLPSGKHHVDIEAITPDGTRLTYPTFEITVLAQLPTLIPQRHSIPFIEADYRYQTHYPGQPFMWNIGLQGGAPPYKVSVSWGDGSESTYTRTNGDQFSIAHAFAEKQTYTVFVRSTDSEGVQAILQLFAIVKGADGSVAAATKPGPLIGLLATLQHYLWIVWPAYIAVLLMVFSYWLGEKEMYLRFMGRPLAHHGPGGGTKRRRL